MSLEAINTSAYHIATIKELPKGWRCISVNEESFPNYPIGFDPEFKDKRVLRVKFSDVAATTKKAGYGDMLFNPITKEIAYEIYRFVEENKDKNFLVHCQAGVSRSSAICLFIKLAYGHQLKKDFWAVSKPNAIVLGALLISKSYSDSLNVP